MREEAWEKFGVQMRIAERYPCPEAFGRNLHVTTPCFRKRCLYSMSIRSYGACLSACNGASAAVACVPDLFRQNVDAVKAPRQLGWIDDN